jgi:hypothetical protein
MSVMEATPKSSLVNVQAIFLVSGLIPLMVEPSLKTKTPVISF